MCVCVREGACVCVRVCVGLRVYEMPSGCFFELFNLNYQCEICNKSVIVCCCTHTHAHLHVCLCVGLLSTVWDSSALPQLFQIAPLDSFFYDCFMYCAIKTKIMANRKYKHTHTHTYSHIYTHTFTFSYTHWGTKTHAICAAFGGLFHAANCNIGDLALYFVCNGAYAWLCECAGVSVCVLWMPDRVCVYCTLFYLYFVRLR